MYQNRNKVDNNVCEVFVMIKESIIFRINKEMLMMK